MKKGKMIPETKNAAQPKVGSQTVTLSQFIDMQIQGANVLLSNLFKARDAAAAQEKRIAELEAKSKTP